MRYLLGSLALLLALFATIGQDVGQASSQRVLSVTAFPTATPARGGEARITVRIPAEAAGDETRVTLSTELGAFSTASGPPEIRANLFDVGNDTLGATVMLVGDGRSGAAVVRAQVGSLVDTVTVRFVGDTADLRLERPGTNARLEAARQHRIVVVATDDTETAAPSTRVRFELLAAPAGATVRGAGESSTSAVSAMTDQSGRASVTLESAPGDVRLRASSGGASIEMEFQLYGEPRTLRLVPLTDPLIEAGSVADAGSVQALLLDERGQGVPNERISFSSEGGLAVAWDGDGESQVTDDSGAARVHLDARSARLGAQTMSGTWSAAGRSLTHTLDVVVTGSPVALYLRAEPSLAELDVALIEVFASSTRYKVTAEIVDRLGQPVAGEYRVRWRPVTSGVGAQVYPEVSVSEGGLATAIFDVQHVDGRPQTESIEAQAFLTAKAQVNDHGVIADLLGDGLPLRASWNSLIWRGGTTTVSQAIAPIRHVVTAAWQRTETGRWQAWFTADVPGAQDFVLEPGDSFNLVLRSAASLEQVERR